MMKTISNFFHKLFNTRTYRLKKAKEELAWLEMNYKYKLAQIHAYYWAACIEFDRKRKEAGTIED